jgi:hypothetical protein
MTTGAAADGAAQFPVAESKVSVRSHYVDRVGRTVVRTSPFIPVRTGTQVLLTLPGIETSVIEVKFVRARS